MFLIIPGSGFVFGHAIRSELILGPLTIMVEPSIYFCTSGPATAVCFFQPESPSLRGKTFLVAGTGNGSLSTWDLKSYNLEQVNSPKEVIQTHLK